MIGKIESGSWRIITGQTEPYWQGWFSPGFDQIEPAPTLYYSCREPQTDARFVTTIRLVPAMP